MDSNDLFPLPEDDRIIDLVIGGKWPVPEDSRNIEQEIVIAIVTEKGRLFSRGSDLIKMLNF